MFVPAALRNRVATELRLARFNVACAEQAFTRAAKQFECGTLSDAGLRIYRADLETALGRLTVAEAELSALEQGDLFAGEAA